MALTVNTKPLYLKTTLLQMEWLRIYHYGVDTILKDQF